MKNIFEENKNEIIWNLINSVLAGGLVFVGAFADGNITRIELIISAAASLIVLITKFKDYWTSQESEYSKKVFKFL